MSIPGFYSEIGVSEHISDTDPMHSVLVEQVERSVIESFGKMCGTTTISEVPNIGNRKRIKIAGIISFVGDLVWTMTLILPYDSAEIMAKNFTGFEIAFESADMGDVVGELTNVIAGILSGNLESCGIRSQMSLPTVARGDAFELMKPDHLIYRRMYFLAAGNDFWVDVSSIKAHLD